MKLSSKCNICLSGAVNIDEPIYGLFAVLGNVVEFVPNNIVPACVLPNSLDSPITIDAPVLVVVAFVPIAILSAAPLVLAALPIAIALTEFAAESTPIAIPAFAIVVAALPIAILELPRQLALRPIAVAPTNVALAPFPIAIHETSAVVALRPITIVLTASLEQVFPIITVFPPSLVQLVPIITQSVSAFEVEERDPITTERIPLDDKVFPIAIESTIVASVPTPIAIAPVPDDKELRPMQIVFVFCETHVLPITMAFVLLPIIVHVLPIIMQLLLTVLAMDELFPIVIEPMPAAVVK